MIPVSLILAIAAYESAGNNGKVGAHGELGLLQIRKAVVADCNRIQKVITFTHDDARNPERAKLMFEIYINHYATFRRIGTHPTPRDMALIWHHGPVGWALPDWDQYAQRVVALMKEQDRGVDIFRNVSSSDWKYIFLRDRLNLDRNALPPQVEAAILFPR